MSDLKLSFNAKSLYFLPVIVCLLILVLPATTLAQDGKDGLLLNYASGVGYNSQIAPGETKTLYIEVTNTSNTPTTNIQFSSDAPAGWLLEFNPHSIDILDTNGYQTVDVIVTAPLNVEKGDYSITVIADSSAGRRVLGTYFWVEKGTNIWVWVGGALGVAVIVLFVFIYRRFNKE
jgi:uncharacterized repeat protein (TIGR01451 family)